MVAGDGMLEPDSSAIASPVASEKSDPLKTNTKSKLRSTWNWVNVSCANLFDGHCMCHASQSLLVVERQLEYPQPLPIVTDEELPG